METAEKIVRDTITNTNNKEQQQSTWQPDCHSEEAGCAPLYKYFVDGKADKATPADARAMRAAGAWLPP